MIINTTDTLADSACWIPTGKLKWSNFLLFFNGCWQTSCRQEQNFQWKHWRSGGGKIPKHFFKEMEQELKYDFTSKILKAEQLKQWLPRGESGPAKAKANLSRPGVDVQVSWNMQGFCLLTFWKVEGWSGDNFCLLGKCCEKMWPKGLAEIGLRNLCHRVLLHVMVLLLILIKQWQCCKNFSEKSLQSCFGSFWLLFSF